MADETYQQKVSKVQKEKGHFQKERNLGRRIQVELENMAEIEAPDPKWTTNEVVYAHRLGKSEGILKAMDRVLVMVQEAKYE